MSKNNLKQAQSEDMPDRGMLGIQVSSSVGMIPVNGARVSISYTGQPQQVLEQLVTDDSGQTENVELAAPPIEFSLSPSQYRPYSEYNVLVEAPGYEPVSVSGSEILPERTAVQNIVMNPLEITEQREEDIVIPDHTLYGDYPAKIPEAEIKPLAETGEIVLSRVVIPEYVVVHDGVPSDSSATNYYVKYKDYIKNVVSSEIYATWDEAAIYANTLCILSVTLNRVFTEW